MTTPVRPSQLISYITVDGGRKIPMDDNAAEGFYSDFRGGFIKPLTRLGNNGTLLLDTGVWEHFTFSDYGKRKIRGWLGITYSNRNLLNFFAAVRGYAGTVPETPIGMVAYAAALGVKPELCGPLKLELSLFAVPHEEYYNAPIENANFYIGTLAPFLDFGNLKIKFLAQVWRIDTNLTDPTLHTQLGLGTEWRF